MGTLRKVLSPELGSLCMNSEGEKNHLVPRRAGQPTVLSASGNQLPPSARSFVSLEIIKGLTNTFAIPGEQLVGDHPPVTPGKRRAGAYNTLTNRLQGNAGGREQLLVWGLHFLRDSEESAAKCHQNHLENQLVPLHLNVLNTSALQLGRIFPVTASSTLLPVNGTGHRDANTTKDKERVRTNPPWPCHPLGHTEGWCYDYSAPLTSASARGRVPAERGQLSQSSCQRGTQGSPRHWAGPDTPASSLLRLLAVCSS